MSLVKLSVMDGSYTRLKAGWREQCEQAGEEADLYAQGTFIVLDQLAAKPERRAGIFAVQRGDDLPEIICQANCTPLALTAALTLQPARHLKIAHAPSRSAMLTDLWRRVATACHSPEGAWAAAT